MLFVNVGCNWLVSWFNLMNCEVQTGIDLQFCCLILSGKQICGATVTAGLSQMNSGLTYCVSCKPVVFDLVCNC